MKINEALNLVVPIYGDDEQVLGYVHSTPLSRAAFEANFRLIAGTFAAIFDEGLGETSGPRVASLVMRDVAERKRVDPKPFFDEVQRLSCLIRPGVNGWEQIPLSQAIDGRLIGEDDAADVMSAITFFTVAWAMWPRNRRVVLIQYPVRLFGAETTSLRPTEWIASLSTSTRAATSGETEPSGVIPT